MSTVLLAIDDDEQRALAQADAVATLADGRDDLTAMLFHVFTENPHGASVHQLSSIRTARERLTDAGIETMFAESSGNPADEILTRARDHDVDLISVAGRTRSPAGKALLGSVSQQVLLEADQPVLFTTSDV